jgi:hypothetical protein
MSKQLPIFTAYFVVLLRQLYKCESNYFLILLFIEI